MNRVINKVINEQNVKRINDYQSLITFLKDDLEWPIPENVQTERLAYEYFADELRLSEEDTKHIEGSSIRQLMEPPKNKRNPIGLR